MDKFTQETVDQIYNEIKTVLAPIEQKYGFEIVVSDMKYSDIYAEAVIGLNITGKESMALEARRLYFEQHCDDVGLDKSHFNMEFIWFPTQKTCIVYGIDFHNEEYPIVIQEKETGKLFRTNTMFFLNCI